MVACVSPADTNLEESLNTLRYASRARNIKNSAVRNVVDSTLSASEVTALRQENEKLKLQIRQLQCQSTLPSFGLNSSLSIFPCNLSAPSAQYTLDSKIDNLEIDNLFTFGMDADNAKDNDESFDSTQHNIRNELAVMSGSIEEKEKIVKQISLDHDQIESMKQHVQAAIGALQHEVDTLSRERDELLSKNRCGTSRSIPNSKVNERISLLENQIRSLKEKLADQSRVLRQREEAEKKFTQLLAEISDDKRKRASLQRKLKEISEERRAEKKAAAVNASKMLRDSQKLKLELSKVKEAAARQEAVFKRKTAEAMLKRTRRVPSSSTNDNGISLERKEELISWMDKEISSTLYLNNLRAQIEIHNKRYQDLANLDARLHDGDIPVRSMSKSSLEAERMMTSDMISQLERSIEEVMSICSTKPSTSSVPFLDEAIWNTLSLSDLRFVAITFFERFLSATKSETSAKVTIEAEELEHGAQVPADDIMCLQSTVDNLLKSVDFSKSGDIGKNDGSDVTHTDLPPLNPFLLFAKVDHSPAHDDDGASLEDSSDSDWSPTKAITTTKKIRSKKKTSSESNR